MPIQKSGKGIDWKMYADPCKKGSFSLMCPDCNQYFPGHEIVGMINAFVTCPGCGGNKWIVFTSTPSIHDTCMHCDEECKIPEPRAPCGMYLWKMKTECNVDTDCRTCNLNRANTDASP